MEPIPTEVSPGKISMCSIICNVHAYMCVRMYIMLGFQWANSYRLAFSCTTYMLTYLCDCYTFARTVLLSLSRTVYTYVHTYMYICVRTVYVCKDLYYTYVILNVKIYVHTYIHMKTYVHQLNLYWLKKVSHSYFDMYVYTSQ